VPLFYDDYEKVELWGKDLYEHLHEVYSKMARYCVLFVSAEYAAKVWTTHERRASQVRALSEKQREYILPARFDDTEVPGLNTNIKHVDCRTTSPLQLADMIIEKLGGFQRRNFLPNDLDLLYVAMGVKTKGGREHIDVQARRFFQSFVRMDTNERKVVAAVLLNGCIAELPDNLHMSLDLLRRITGFPTVRIQELLTGVQALGIVCAERATQAEHDHAWHPQDSQVVLEFHTFLAGPHGGPATHLAQVILKTVAQNYCEEHTAFPVENADFGTLSSKVSSRHRHDDTVAASVPKAAPPRKAKKRRR